MNSYVNDYSGAWVKIPTLQPSEPNALMFLNMDNLKKLQARVEVAIKKATTQARQVRQFTPGARVALRHGYCSMSPGTRGLVADRVLLRGYEDQPGYYVPVCFQNHGLGWVPASLLEQQA